jgi:hypothetical protein
MLLLPLTTTTTTDVYGQTGSMVTLQNIRTTYPVSIVPLPREISLHYYPAIAVPVGMTAAWFSNDQEQPHTVTSGVP